jgi:hypothetical protein
MTKKSFRIAVEQQYPGINFTVDTLNGQFVAVCSRSGVPFAKQSDSKVVPF